MSKTYDLAQLRELAGDSEEFVIEMVSAFLEHGPSQIEEINDAMKTLNYIEVGRAAHKIKPTLDLMGVESLEKVIRKIEQYGKNEENLNELPALIKTVNDEIVEVFSEMKLEYEIS